jgi:hypothetical protein
MSQKDIQRFALAQDSVRRPVSMCLIVAVLGSVSPKRTPTMTSRRRFMAICFGLVVGLWCTADAFAQARPTSPQSEDADHPTVEEASSGINWATIRWIERRYKIEAMRFKARDETGIVWLGSDEVMIETTDAKGWTVSNEIGDIDSGNTHNFDPAKSCIVAVRPGFAVLGQSSVCEEVGEPAPLGFQVEFWEQDSAGFPLGFCGSEGGPLEPGRHGGLHHAGCPNSTGFNDFIGSALIDYSPQELEAALPYVGNEQIESITLIHCPGETCGDGPGPWNFGDYTFTWRVTRLPNRLVGFPSVLGEAMRISGARSELEAIRAGLRILRAPTRNP